MPAKLPQPQSPIAGGPQSRKRIDRLKQKQIAGPPLAETLRQQNPDKSLVGARQYLIAIALAVSAALVVTGTIASSLFWIFAGTGSGLIALVVFLTRPRTTNSYELKLVVDAEELDRLLTQHATSLPAEAVTLIATIKESLALVLAGTPPIDDALFAREMVARYIPDACRHYADLKTATRTLIQLSTDRTAEDSLLEQLRIMNTRLTGILEVVIAEKAEKLKHHEKFIRMKI